MIMSDPTRGWSVTVIMLTKVFMRMQSGLVCGLHGMLQYRNA